MMYLRIINNNELSRKYIANDSTYRWSTLEANLGKYMQDREYAKPFDMTNIPVVSSAQEIQEIQRIFYLTKDKRKQPVNFQALTQHQ